VSGRDELGDDGGPDEPGRAGDEDAHEAALLRSMSVTVIKP
jgi:hypothetical protein